MLSNLPAALLLALLGSWPGIRENVLKPLLARMGTALATLLVSWGASAGHVEAFVAGFISLSLILFDLLVDWFNRRKAVARAKGEG